MKTSKFSILDHIDKLTAAKEQGKYFCPICNGHNLSIDQKSGAYKCWNGCDCKDIREALAPWSERNGQQNTRVIYRKAKPKTPRPTPLPDQFVLATLPEVPADIPQRKSRRDSQHGEVWELLYIYSPELEVLRTEWANSSKRKGYDKTVIPYHLDSEGEILKGKGNNSWPMYRELEALQHGIGKWVLLPEGESCVEICRWLQMIGITFQGADWSEETIHSGMLRLKEEGITGVVYLPDNDDTGRRKADKCASAAAKVGIPLLNIPPLALWDDMPEKGDIVDWVLWGMQQGMDREAFIRQLERVFHAVAAERVETEKQTNAETEGNFDGDANDGAHSPEIENPNWVNPESPLAGTIESLTLNTLFEGGQGKYVSIDDTFYVDTEKGFYSKSPDSAIFKAITHKIAASFTFKKSRETITKVYLYATDAKMKSCFQFCRKAIDVGELPANRHLRCFANCTVDLRTGQSIPHDRNHFLTTAIAADYKPDQPCPEIFLNFIKSAYGEEQLEAVRAYTSMFLDPTAPYGKFVHLMGPSGSGKGTLLRLWGELYSLEHYRSGDFKNLATAEGRHQYLTGAALYAVPDVGGFIQGLKPFYELVDNGPMTGRALFSSNGYQKKWDVRFVVASVDYLQIENSGDGWDRRCLPLITKPREGIEDPELGNKLAEVKGQIISWALAMPREERDRLILSPSTNEQIQQHQLDAAIHGDPVRAFIDLCFRPCENAISVHTHQLHSWFKVFAETHGYQGWGMSKLASHLKTILPNHYVQRRRATVQEDPMRGIIPGHWINIMPVPGVFIDISQSGEDGDKSEANQEPIWKCIKADCREGGLVALQEFKKSRGGSPGSPTSPDLPKVSDPQENIVQQDFQKNGSGGSGRSQGGVDKLKMKLIEEQNCTNNSSVRHCSSPPPPVPDPGDLPDPWAETIEVTCSLTDQAVEKVADPSEKVTDPSQSGVRFGVVASPAGSIGSPLPHREQLTQLEPLAPNPAVAKPLKVGDAVAHSDPYMVAYSYHGTVEVVSTDEVLVRWVERCGQPNEIETYGFHDLRLVERKQG